MSDVDQTAAQPRAMVICDGDLASLVCLALEVERSATGESAPPLAIVPSLADDARATAAAKMCESLGVEWTGQERYASAIDQTRQPAWSRTSRWLLDTAVAAAQLGADRLVWPARVDAETIEDVGAAISELADIADRALLVGRLVAGDLMVSGADRAFVIETPVCDLCDGQLAELAADLAAPVEQCWWMSGRGQTAESARERWLTPLQRHGWKPPAKAG